jgi:hypothetical protein
MINECGAVGGMRIGRGNRRTRGKTRAVPLCPLEIPHDLNWDRTRAGRPATYRLNYCTTFYSYHHHYHHHCLPYNYCRLYWSNSVHVRFEVFTAVTVKNTVIWNVAPCRSCVNRRFGGTYRLHLLASHSIQILNDDYKFLKLQSA